MAPSIPRLVEQVQSWGRLGAHEHTVVTPHFLDEVQVAMAACDGPVLAFGAGRSYGDVALNRGGLLMRFHALDRIIAADWATGVVRAEAGMSLDALLRLAVPKGWFLPVTPGTKFCTLGGAVANDVHGKNHESAGTIGMHIRRIALLRSTEGVIEISLQKRPDLFRATIGGLGLTGLILWVELALKPITSAFIEVETIPMTDLDTFFRLAPESRDWDYTVAWVDCLAAGAGIGRGLFMRGRHLQGIQLVSHPPPRLTVPIDAPTWLLNGRTVRIFNKLFQARRRVAGWRIVSYDRFFYPLDSIGAWNRLYGSRGFFQHQCVVPMNAAPDAIRQLLALTAEFGEGSFLVVLKLFGDRRSPGWLSFPKAGATLALDLPNRGDSTRRLLQAMTDVVMAAEGRIYPAKDATMTADAFHAGFPEWRKVEALRDPKIMSDFWRRVAA